MIATIRHVTKPSDAELDQYTEVLHDAFEHKFFAFALPDATSIKANLRTHMTAALVAPGAEIHVAELPDQGVVGVAVWFGPGSKFLDSEAQRNAGWNQLMAKLEPRLSEWWPQFLEEYDQMVNDSIGAEAKLAGWHLQLIGILPGQQGKGIGTQLMRLAEDKARAARVASVLETGSSGNVKAYQALGYTLAGSSPCRLPKRGDDPPGTFVMYALIKHTEQGE